MRRLVIARDTYYESLAALEDSDAVAEVAKALLVRVANRPELGMRIPSSRLMVQKARSWNAEVAMRLYYYLTEDTVYLLYLEAYDELA